MAKQLTSFGKRQAAARKELASRIALGKDPVPATVAAVNAALNKLGIAERLVRGRGYHYFRLGDAHTWPSSSVYVYDVDTFTVAEWIEEHKQLQAAAAAR